MTTPAFPKDQEPAVEDIRNALQALASIDGPEDTGDVKRLLQAAIEKLERRAA